MILLLDFDVRILLAHLVENPVLFIGPSQSNVQARGVLVLHYLSRTRLKMHSDEIQFMITLNQNWHAANCSVTPQILQ